MSMVEEYPRSYDEPRTSAAYQDMTVMAGDGMVGDCFRACIATVTGKRTEGVPHFGLLGDLHAMETAVAWLNYQGYEVGMSKDDFPELKLMPLHVMRGFSPRGIYHGVVGDTATGAMVHDPHPSRAGIKSTESRLYLFEKTHNSNSTTDSVG